MPTSDFHLIPAVVAAVKECSEKYGVSTVLDVGCGAGLYGALLRQYLDHAHNRFDPEDDNRAGLYGIEPFEGYENPNWKHYNVVRNTNIQDFLAQEERSEYHKRYDVVLALDCLEHMPIVEAERVMKALYGLTEKYLIITSPSYFREQWQPEKPWEDSHQDHLSFLPPDLITATFPRVRIQDLGSVYIAVVKQEMLPVR